MPDDVACFECGEKAIERAREGVETWLHMHAERVKDLTQNDRTG